MIGGYGGDGKAVIDVLADDDPRCAGVAGAGEAQGGEGAGGERQETSLAE